MLYPKSRNLSKKLSLHEKIYFHCLLPLVHACYPADCSCSFSFTNTAMISPPPPLPQSGLQHLQRSQSFTQATLDSGANLIYKAGPSSWPVIRFLTAHFYAGLIFAVTQDQGKCYQSKGAPLTYYNRDTCLCECTQACKCGPTPKSPYIWQPYPTCACTCAVAVAVAKKCQDYQYWDDKTCSCKCKKVVCPLNFYQNMNNCKCIKRCAQQPICPKGFTFRQYLCRCIPGILTDAEMSLMVENPSN